MHTSSTTYVCISVLDLGIDSKEKKKEKSA